MTVLSLRERVSRARATRWPNAPASPPIESPATVPDHPDAFAPARAILNLPAAAIKMGFVVCPCQYCEAARHQPFACTGCGYAGAAVASASVIRS